VRERDAALIAAEWLQRRARHLWRDDALRGGVLLGYYLALIAVLVHLYGSGRYTPPPFIYQGF